MPDSWGRSSSRPAADYGPDGELWLAWPTDGRLYEHSHRPLVGNVYAARLLLEDPAQAPVLGLWQSPEPEKVKPGHANEPLDLKAIRSYRTFVHGEEKRIVRGDFHRHTELSWDAGGRWDGSLFDFYRYMIDAAAMDFGAVTDHFAGGGHEYWWWLTEKSCDLYHLPRTFTTFYGLFKDFLDHGQLTRRDTRSEACLLSEPREIWVVDRIERDTAVLLEDGTGRTLVVSRSLISVSPDEGTVLRVPVTKGGGPAWSLAEPDEKLRQRRLS